MKLSASLVLMVVVLSASHLLMVQSDYSPEEIKNFVACLGTDLETQFKPCMAPLMAAKCFAPTDSALNAKCAKDNCKEVLDWKKIDSCAREAHAKMPKPK